MIYGVFAGIWAMARFGGRNTLLVGLAWFAVGNLLCGAATDVTTLAAAKLVEGMGKGMVILLCRACFTANSTAGHRGHRLLRRDRLRDPPHDAALTALINDALSWRWIFWVNVPLALLAFPLVLRFIKPDRPAQPLPLRIDWVGVTLFVVWIVSLTLHLRLVSQVGRLDIQRLHRDSACLPCCCPLSCWPRVGAGLAVSEHLSRMFRVRGYVLAMCVAHALAGTIAGGADADGELLRRSSRLPPGSGRLDPGAGHG